MLKYIGDGSALVIDQVPARDLTDEEVEQFGEEKLINSGLYAKPDRTLGGPVDPKKLYLVGEKSIEQAGE